jgi:hypothetical protein
MPLPCDFTSCAECQADDLNQPCPHGHSVVTCVACLDEAAHEMAVLAALEES